MPSQNVSVLTELLQATKEKHLSSRIVLYCLYYYQKYTCTIILVKKDLFLT